MDELIVKWVRGEATDIEVRQLDHWRARSPENEKEFHALTGLWNRIAEPDAPTVGPAPTLEEIVGEGDARRARSQARAARRIVFRSPWAAVGLTAAAVVVLAVFALGRDSEQAPSTHSLFPVESSSGSGDITTLSLSDGSVVRVVPETRVEFPATVDLREVVLEGKAFFAVAPDPIPFVVRTRMGEVRVKGTRFEVVTDGDELKLVVVEGRVRLEGESGFAEVGPGQVAFLSVGSSPRIVDHGDVWSVLEWPDGLLVYEATPLSMVVEELSRHFDRNVTLSDEGLGQIRITAWFQDESIEEVISAVCLVAGASCEVGESTVIIGR